MHDETIGKMINQVLVTSRASWQWATVMQMDKLMTAIGGAFPWANQCIGRLDLGL